MYFVQLRIAPQNPKTPWNYKVMEGSRFEETVKETEKRLFRANSLYHKCLSKVILKFMDGEKGYENVEEHCKE